MFKVTEKEKQALHRYTSGRQYATINALLYEGMENEMAKKSEGKTILLEDKETLEGYIEIIVLMYSAMYKRFKAGPRSIIRTRRVDRMSTFKEYSNRRCITSNLSTTKGDFIIEYAKSKKDPVFLELLLLPNVLYADMQEILGEAYEKADEKEVLIAPFTQITKVNRIIGSAIPRYELVLAKANLPNINMTEQEGSRRRIFQNFDDCKCIMDKMDSHRLSNAEIRKYCAWKNDIIKYVKAKCREVELQLR